MESLENFYLKHQEPARSCFLALRDIILSYDKEITAAWKYGMPFFYFRGKMFSYLWMHKKYRQPYIGIVEGKWFDDPDMLMEKRSRIKILLVDPDKDIPVSKIEGIIEKAIDLYKTGVVKTTSRA